MELSTLSLHVHALSVLRGLHRHPLVHAYADTLDALDRSPAAFADCYGALCEALFACGGAHRALLDAVHFDANTLTDRLDTPDPSLLDAATHDIAALNGLLA